MRVTDRLRKCYSDVIYVKDLERVCYMTKIPYLLMKSPYSLIRATTLALATALVGLTAAVPANVRADACDPYYFGFGFVDAPSSADITSAAMASCIDYGQNYAQPKAVVPTCITDIQTMPGSPFPCGNGYPDQLCRRFYGYCGHEPNPAPVGPPNPNVITDTFGAGVIPLPGLVPSNPNGAGQ